MAAKNQGFSLRMFVVCAVLDLTFNQHSQSYSEAMEGRSGWEIVILDCLFLCLSSFLLAPAKSEWAIVHPAHLFPGLDWLLCLNIKFKMIFNFSIVLV